MALISPSTQPNPTPSLVLKCVLIASLGLLAYATPAFAQETPTPPNRLESPQNDKAVTSLAIDKKPGDTYQLGQPFDISFTVHHPAGTIVEVPQAFDSSRWSVQKVVTDTNPQKTESTVHYTFAIYRPGETTLQPFSIQLISPDGKESQLKVGPFTTHIASALAPTDKAELSQQLPGVDIWVKDFTPIYIASSIVLLLALLSYALYRKKQGEEVGPPELPPNEIALKRLNLLQQSGAAETGESMYFYVSLSEILREFLGKTFSIHATEMTTSELNHSLAPLLASERAPLIQLFERADAVKFAKFTPPTSAPPQDLHDAFHFVEVIKAPQPTPADENEDAEATDISDEKRPDEVSNAPHKTNAIHVPLPLSADNPTPTDVELSPTPPSIPFSNIEKNDLAYLPPHIREAFARAEAAKYDPAVTSSPQPPTTPPLTPTNATPPVEEATPNEVDPAQPNHHDEENR